MSDDLETVHTYPSESVAMEIYDEVHAKIVPDNLNDERSIDDVIANERDSVDFHCYMPNSFTDLAGTLERERRTLARQNEKVASEKEDANEKNMLSALGNNNSLFTETSAGETNAILF